MQRLIALVVVFGGHMLVSPSADAGVKGGRFVGSVFNSFNNIVTVDDSFYLNNSIRQVESDAFTFNGTYSEQGFLGVTTWQATLQDGSPSGFGLVGGTCYFGLVTTHWTLNEDINISAFGLLFRSGSVGNPTRQR